MRCFGDQTSHFDIVVLHADIHGPVVDRGQVNPNARRLKLASRSRHYLSASDDCVERAIRGRVLSFPRCVADDRACGAHHFLKLNQEFAALSRAFAVADCHGFLNSFLDVAFVAMKRTKREVRWVRAGVVRHGAESGSGDDLPVDFLAQMVVAWFTRGHGCIVRAFRNEFQIVPIGTRPTTQPRRVDF